jgi:hypothetical protein
MGAYDTGHWETVVAQLKPNSGVLLRGSVLSAVAADGGKLSHTVGGAEATAYGVLLDASVDTAAPWSGGRCHGFSSPCGVVPEALLSSSGLEPMRQR